MSGMWSIRDSHAHKEYRYSAEGLLVSVTDKNGCRLTLSYRGEYPEKLTTALGYEIYFTFTDGKLTGLKDGTGRTMTYHYKNGLLSHVVHMDGGMSRYDYTQDGYLERPTDQTGLSYLTNCYDERGRVVLQTLANGETYRVSYHDKERKTCMEYSAYPGEKTYIYNEKMAVTQVLYPDGTKEAFVFDAKNNRIVETDRLGRSIRRAYDEKGRLIREERPQGLVAEYVYNEMGDLVLVHDNGERSKEISYDDSHNLIIRRTRTAEGQWMEQTYAYDSMGRLVREQDGEGHATRYSYRDNLAYPYRTVYADGSEVWYEYDRNGCMLSEEDSTG